MQWIKAKRPISVGANWNFYQDGVKLTCSNYPDCFISIHQIITFWAIVTLVMNKKTCDFANVNTKDKRWIIRTMHKILVFQNMERNICIIKPIKLSLLGILSWRIWSDLMNKVLHLAVAFHTCKVLLNLMILLIL